MNWKLILLRILVNGLTIAIVALLMPNIEIVGDRLGTLLVLGAVFGLLNAILKPALQFILFPLIFVSFGLVVVVINALLLWFLSWLLPGLLQVTGVLAALFGGALVGLLAIMLETVLGMTPPILDDAPATSNE